MSELCDAKIRPMPNATEIQCDVAGPHEQHLGALKGYAYPGSVTTVCWMEDDRRNFRGEWTPCPNNCTLPADHRGQCAP